MISWKRATKVTLVVYEVPKYFGSEMVVRIVDSRDVESVTMNAPRDAISFYFVDEYRLSLLIGVHVRALSGQFDKSCMYYIYATRLNLREIHDSFVLSGLRVAGAPEGVQCRNGMVRPLFEGDIVISIRATAKSAT